MSFRPKIHKRYRSLVAEAEERGWTLTTKRHGHFKLTAPDGYATPVPTNDNPGLYRAWSKRLLDHPSFADSEVLP